MSKKLIALVAVVAFVDGVRKEFPPGSELPPLSEHDEKELKRMLAIEDPADREQADAAAAKQAKADAGDFERERKAIRAAQESIAVPGDGKKPAPAQKSTDKT